MAPRCLICDSKVVLSKELASATATIIGTLEGFLFGISEARQRTSEVDISALIVDGLAGVKAAHQGSLEFSRDMQKYQFGGHECLCLRCGARFD